MSGAVPRDTDIPVDGEGAPVGSKGDQLCAVRCELVHNLSVCIDRVDRLAGEDALVTG